MRRWLLICLAALPALAWGQQLELRFEGDYPALRQNVEAFLGTVEDRSEDGLRRYADHAVEQAQQALRALGYYNPDIEWRISAETPPKLVMRIAPGEPVRITSRTVRVVGAAASDPEFAPIAPDRLAVGSVLDHSAYESVKSTLQNRAARLGYFDGRFTSSRLAVDPDALSAEVELVYRSGERYRLGEVRFEPGHPFEEDLLEKFVTFEPGTPYHADKVAKLSKDLSDSGYFSQVFVDSSPQDTQDRTLPVTVRLSARDRRSVAAGVGFSTDVGPRVRGSWTEYWVNPMGHRRSVESEVSAPRQSLSAWYELPLDPPMTDSIRFTTGYLREDIEDVESQRLTLGQQWQHGLADGWQQILSLRWEGERFQIGDEDTNTSSLFLPGASYSKLVSDSPVDPSRGYRLTFETVGSHRSLLSDADILQLQALARGLITVGDGHRFLARLKLGAVATNDFEDVPPSLRFFAGGDQSVRGYGYETLSPKDENGNDIGGRYLLVGSVEYQFPLTDNWRLAAFADEGNAVNDFFEPRASGVGVGIRWVSPVGPLRLDIAKGLDRDLGGGWRIHFSMGPEL
ncbi:MAG: autotransporter assembly complex family protein [Marinobacter sp.]|uniref:autotransporter assembly complex protein TamA n=1 Tax=Marinobacter sp. TaxID=50741 RepID=UPI00299E8B13|nr:autotransporter assembly complex family protein [Marinobacter sp.]MDX1633452.1 autotransporter assembly complex family protein [Marinobacter sp.]